MPASLIPPSRGQKRPIQHRYSLVGQREWCFATSPAYPRRPSCETAISGPSEEYPKSKRGAAVFTATPGTNNALTLYTLTI